jgi:hypothetical protein
MVDNRHLQDVAPPPVKKYGGYRIQPHLPLTAEQKRIGSLLHLGISKKELSVKFDIPFVKLVSWTKNPRFQRYLYRLERDLDAALARRAKALLEDAFKTLERMLKSGHFPSEQFAVETVFHLNHRGTAEPPANGNGNGAVSVNLVQNTVDIGSLDPEKKEKVKELLSITRSARPTAEPEAK